MLDVSLPRLSQKGAGSKKNPLEGPKRPRGLLRHHVHEDFSMSGVQLLPAAARQSKLEHSLSSTPPVHTIRCDSVL